MKTPNLRLVHMRQVMSNRWQLEAAVGGYVLQNDIVLCSEVEAHDYAKRYISSFSDWIYLIVPLRDNKNLKD